MSLKNKASLINLDLDAESVQVGETQAEAPRSHPSRGRSGVAAITNSINTQHRIQDLEAEVAQLQSAQVVLRLDPKVIQQSRWKNRDELSYATQAYTELKKEIAEAGGNVQPIKVRRISKAEEGDAQRYEIVYGRRRLRACLELGIPVNAIVEELNDMSLFIEMERENRNREDLSPWEQGVMYKDGLDAGLFPSQRQMAAALGLNVAILSTAVRLASLPVEIIEAFRSPLDIQFRWVKPLVDALEKDPVKVTRVASELAKASPRLASKETLERLVEVVNPVEGMQLKPIEIKRGERVVGTIEQSRRGAVSIKVAPGILSGDAVQKLGDELRRLAQMA